MRKLFFSFLTLVLPLSQALAVEVRDCDWVANARNIPEPWDKHTRIFDNGNIRIAHLDTGGEPVCCSSHLLILAVDKTDPHQNRMCKIVGNREQMGFNWIDFQKTRIDHARANGIVIVTFPYTLYIDGVRSRNGVGRVVIDTNQGTITAR